MTQPPVPGPPAPSAPVLGGGPAAAEDDRSGSVALSRSPRQRSAQTGRERGTGRRAGRTARARGVDVEVELVARAVGDHDRAEDALVGREAADAAEQDSAQRANAHVVLVVPSRGRCPPGRGAGP